jgi:hypothetical protein
MPCKKWHALLKIKNKECSYAASLAEEQITPIEMIQNYINHSSIHYSTTPIFQVLLTSSFGKERMPQIRVPDHLKTKHSRKF